MMMHFTGMVSVLSIPGGQWLSNIRKIITRNYKEITEGKGYGHTWYRQVVTMMHIKSICSIAFTPRLCG
jgi:hypothetical protein